MTLKDIGIYKTRLLSAIVNSKDICELILGNGCGNDNLDERLMYKNVFPFLYIDDTQTKQESYICIEVDVPRTMDFTFKDMKVHVWCYCHKDIMQYQKNDYLGTRTDILSDMVDRLLNSSNDYGLGRLKLKSCDHFYPSKEHYGRELIYSCTEFNIDKKLER